ncbi:hypothetical protein niasHT_009720 [Heterodera trifolii]|uniref:Uncharacterized protein n=1 Tax=Heterodera trifolii TaxID=157864 RepID=A0ABD2MDH5_9BILA
MQSCKKVEFEVSTFRPSSGPEFEIRQNGFRLNARPVHQKRAGFLVVYSITNQQSFHDIRTMRDQIIRICAVVGPVDLHQVAFPRRRIFVFQIDMDIQRQNVKIEHHHDSSALDNNHQTTSNILDMDDGDMDNGQQQQKQRLVVNSLNMTRKLMMTETIPLVDRVSLIGKRLLGKLFFLGKLHFAFFFVENLPCSNSTTTDKFEDVKAVAKEAGKKPKCQYGIFALAMRKTALHRTT